MKNISKILLLFGGVVLIVGVIFGLQENKNNSNNDNEASSSQKEDVTDKKLEEIKTEEEWKVIDTIIKTLQDELKKGSEA